jgi:D-glycero-D-manno-heptose 1,7-bisphosphate phosphatase
MKRKAVFLDRDGVINRAVVRDGKPYPPDSLVEFDLLPGVVEAINSLNRAGWLIIVVTNQPDVRTGKQEKKVVEAMHAEIRKKTKVDDIFACFHVDEDRCLCRKPKPGMILDAAPKWSVNIEKSYMVGDRWRDIEAGKRAGCKSILVRSDYKEKKAEDPEAIVESLLEASELILSAERCGAALLKKDEE